MTENSTSDLNSLIENAINCKTEDYHVEVSGNTQGEGFLGEVLFVNLTHKKSKIKHSLVIKQQILVNGTPFEFSNAPFENEVYFFEIIWPALSKFSVDTCGISLNFVPKCLAVSKDRQMKIVLENLKELGFDTYDKTKSFDESHVLKIFKTYGQYHGISMALKEIDNEKFLQLTKGTKNIYKTMFTGEDLMSRGLKYSALRVQNLFDSEREKHLIEKLKEYENKGFEIVHKILTEDVTSRVITHGDCWSNNLMVKYNDNGELQDIRLIDFQFVHTGSPAQDLAYCFYSGASGPNLNKIYDYLKIYHKSLSETLQKCGLNAEELYPYKLLKDEWQRYSKFGFAMGLMIWRTKLAEPNSTPNLPELLENEDFKKANFKERGVKLLEGKNEEYKEKIRDLVMHMYNNNLI